MKLFAANYALVCAHKWSHKFCLTNQGAMKARSCVWITLTSLLAKRLIRPTRFNSKAQSTQLLRVDRRNAEEENSRRSRREKCFANIRKRSRPPHLGFVLLVWWCERYVHFAIVAVLRFESCGLPSPVSGPRSARWEFRSKRRDFKKDKKELIRLCSLLFLLSLSAVRF